MYENVGGKIKGLAKTVAIIGIALSAIAGLIISFMDFPETLIPGILVLGLGAFFSWLSTLAMYGFGQLIENTDKLVAAHNNQTKNNNVVDNNWTCPTCNTSNAPGASFCKPCGNKR